MRLYNNARHGSCDVMQTHYHSRDVNTQLEGEARKQDSAQSTYAAAEKNNLILIDLEQVEMSSLAFVTHPSVRIKGSENVYTPIHCMDQNCPIKTPHLHCPFCVKTDIYQDPVILKAHYRVKHVDKGIEFAGLKILRCCDHCDIVGVIKGEKKFKGAHWHCYRCRNGFNRRDEAVKHYKTHFRNPQTTFQISITQDLNTPVSYNQESRGNPAVTTSSSSVNIAVPQEAIHPALTQAVSCISTPITVSEQVPLTNGKIPDGALHVSIAANETVEGEEEENTQTIMIIQEEQLDASQIDGAFSAQIIASEDVEIMGEKSSSTKTQETLDVQCKRLEQEKNILRSEVARLHKHIQNLEEQLNVAKKREEDLAQRLGIATERGVQEVLQRLEKEHRDLLRQHLNVLQQTVYSAHSPSVLQLTDNNVQQIQVVSPASFKALMVSSNMSRENTTQNLPVNSALVQAGELHLEQISTDEDTGVTALEIAASGAVDGSSNYIMCVKTEAGEVQEGSVLEVHPRLLQEVTDVEPGDQDRGHPPTSKRQKLQ
ncbi:uncharacterized protein LOC112563359 isoform X2 [Pomacea canaliculata]|uniref:uncharacterized protein LOC112563359 isoform X2 n=1 Tax=Pomacea canaliculata TaxID=400727 RepID=UPI000D73BA4E|nr:uncharacterized protein LOC112563359 isoform X2 [Pomacea canaliculata]